MIIYKFIRWFRGSEKIFKSQNLNPEVQFHTILPVDAAGKEGLV
jgi:hypothetical protein